VRKLITALVATAALTVGLTGTASAGGVKGAYGSEKTCQKAANGFAAKYKVKVGPCFKSVKGWYFKYS